MGKNRKQTFGSGRDGKVGGISPDRKSTAGGFKESDAALIDRNFTKTNLELSEKHWQERFEKYLENRGEPRNKSEAELIIEGFFYQVIRGIPESELQLPQTRIKLAEISKSIIPVIIAFNIAARLIATHETSSIDLALVEKTTSAIADVALTTIAGAALAGVPGAVAGFMAGAFIPKAAASDIEDTKQASATLPETPTFYSNLLFTAITDNFSGKDYSDLVALTLDKIENNPGYLTIFTDTDPYYNKNVFLLAIENKKTSIAKGILRVAGPHIEVLDKMLSDEFDWEGSKINAVQAIGKMNDSDMAKAILHATKNYPALHQRVKDNLSKSMKPELYAKLTKGKEPKKPKPEKIYNDADKKLFMDQIHDAIVNQKNERLKELLETSRNHPELHNQLFLFARVPEMINTLCVAMYNNNTEGAKLILKEAAQYPTILHDMLTRNNYGENLSIIMFAINIKNNEMVREILEAAAENFSTLDKMLRLKGTSSLIDITTLALSQNNDQALNVIMEVSKKYPPIYKYIQETISSYKSIARAQTPPPKLAEDKSGKTKSYEIETGVTVALATLAISYYLFNKESKQVVDLKAQLERSKKELADNKQELLADRKSADKNVRTTNQENKGKEKEIGELKKEIGSLKKQQASTLAENKSLRDKNIELKDKESELESKTQTVEFAKKKLAEAGKKAGELQSEIERLEEELAESQKKEAQAAKGLSAAQDQLKKYILSYRQAAEQAISSHTGEEASALSEDYLEVVKSINIMVKNTEDDPRTSVKTYEKLGIKDSHIKEFLEIWNYMDSPQIMVGSGITANFKLPALLQLTEELMNEKESKEQKGSSVKPIQSQSLSSVNKSSSSSRSTS